ncbi:MAG: hypothetical protein ACREHV_01130 [Rhizomicrobium sp.]
MTSEYPSQAPQSDEPVLQHTEGAIDGLSDGAASTQEKLADLAGPVADQARDLAEQQKQSGADRVEEAAEAVHRAADEIAKESPLAGGYMHSGAEQLQRVSRLLRENSVDEIYQMTNRLAHDRPLAFIGGSVAAGFLLARVLRSSAKTPAPTQRGRLS